MPKVVWILEDEPEIAFVYKECLTPQFQLRFFSTIREFNEAQPHADSVHLLIADLRLPDGFFLDHFPKVAFPVMIASSIDDLNTLRSAYRMGAVDYLVKPFRKTELMAKTEAVLAKTRPHFSKEILAELTKKEEQILTILLNAFNQPVLRSQISKSIWGNTHVGGKTLDVHLVNLRKKLLDTPFVIESTSQGGLVLNERQPK